MEIAEKPPPAGVDSSLVQLELTTLRAGALAAIRTGIVTGELQAGEIYSVSFFCSRFGVSATPVREALLELVNDGLARPIRNRGFQIPELSDHDLDEIIELRELLEERGVALVAGHLDDQAIAECRYLAAQIVDSAKTGDLVGYLDFDRSFHARLLSAHGNDRLVRTVTRLRDQTRLKGLPGLVQSADGLERSAKEHTQILDYVVQGDADRAERAMHVHLEHTRGLWAGKRELSGK